MHRPYFALVIRPAVVAGGEGGDRVHPRVEECLLIALFVKRGTNAGDVFGGVEIKVNLSEAQGMHRLEYQG
jgi:hypothetical protein